MLERGFDAHGYQLGSLEGWRKDVGPVIADLDDLMHEQLKHRAERRRFRLEIRDWIQIMFGAIVAADVLAHIFH